MTNPVHVHDDQLKAQLARVAERHEAAADLLGPRRTISQVDPRQREAQRNPAYQVARSIAVHYRVVPLAATAGAGLTGWTPLAAIDDAIQNKLTLADCWATSPAAQPGIVLGRASNVIALHLQTQAAVDWLRDLATQERHDPDSDRSWQEQREIGGTRLRLATPEPTPPRFLSGHARAIGQQLREEAAKRRAFTGLMILWSYPTVISGQDTVDFPARKIHAGAALLGDGDVLPAPGATMPDGRLVVGALPRGDTWMPGWLAALLGTPRNPGAAS